MKHILENNRICAIMRGVPLGKTLDYADAVYRGGVRMFEVAMNSGDAARQIELMRKHFGDNAYVGAGTVISAKRCEAAREAGAQFFLTPSATTGTMEFCRRYDIPLLPGVLTPTDVAVCLEYGYTIIEDTTHSIFTKERTIGDYCVCSLRKWFPVADGGVLYTKKNVTDIWDMAEYRKNYFVDSLEAMILKKYYIQYGVDCNSIYREIFAKSEQQLDMQSEIYQISDISKSILECISIKQLQEKRKKNYSQLKGKLKNIPVKDVLSTDNFVPLVYPVYVENRNQFRQYLMENKIYCAVHWPLAGTGLETDSDAVKIYENIISLPIDQRYESMHMEYLAQVIEAYFKEEKQDGIN